MRDVMRAMPLLFAATLAELRVRVVHELTL
jgi:hypothetical protein